MEELFIPTLNFSILVLLLGYFVWPLTKKYAAQRAIDVKKDLEESEKNLVEARKAYEEINGKLIRFDNELQAMLDKSDLDAMKLKEDIKKSGFDMAERMRKESSQSMLAQTELLKQELQVHAVACAIAAAEKVLKQQTAKESSRTTTQEYVESVS